MVMVTKLRFVVLALVTVALSACLGPRTVDLPKPEPLPPVIKPGALVINEVAARWSTSIDGSENQAIMRALAAAGKVEAGDFPDGRCKWFELYNKTTDTIRIVPGRWFLSDDATNAMKEPITIPFKIAPAGFALVYVDTIVAGNKQLHVNFGLSRNSSYLGIHYRPRVDTATVEIDGLTYPDGVNNVTWGRLPDGGSGKSAGLAPTPNRPNAR